MMPASSRRPCRIARLSSSQERASSSQDTGAPSTTAPASDSKRSLFGSKRHLPGEPNEGSLDGHLSGLTAVLAQRFGHFCPCHLHLDTRDDRVAVVGLQLQEGRFVALEKLGADEFFERGRGGRRFPATQRL